MARVRGQLSGWEESRSGRGEAPSLEELPRFSVGELTSHHVENGDYRYLIDGNQVEPVTLGLDPSTPYLEWNDPELLWPEEPAWRKNYRALQSWYRQEVLNLPPGVHSSDKPLGNLLPESAALQGLNFLHSEIAAYAWERVAEGGSVEPIRLRANMLSSMPLCFNLFGHLRLHPRAAARVFSRLLEINIDRIDSIVVEYAPQPTSAYLDDLTAFDALLSCLVEGTKHFIAIETKYTEPFSQSKYEGKPAYERFTSGQYGFKEGAIDRVIDPKTNQLWRNYLLALSFKEQGGFDDASVVVMSCRGDAGAEAAVSGLKAEIEDGVRLEHITFEDAMDGFSEYESTEYWAYEFKRRYLDLAPVMNSI